MSSATTAEGSDFISSYVEPQLNIESSLNKNAYSIGGVQWEVGLTCAYLLQVPSRKLVFGPSLMVQRYLCHLRYCWEATQVEEIRGANDISRG